MVFGFSFVVCFSQNLQLTTDNAPVTTDN